MDKNKNKVFFVSALLMLFVTTVGGIASAKGKSKHSGGSSSAGNYTIGIGPVGNLYLTERRPELSAGVGALVYFDYRWSPELSTTASVMMLVQDGAGRDTGEQNVVFMGIPTFDIKYYFLTNPSRWDPYGSIGLGYYAVTAGQRGRGVASGMGAQFGGGFDYYITPRVSVGAATQFRSLALLGGGSTGTFPWTFSGNFGFHF